MNANIRRFETAADAAAAYGATIWVEFDGMGLGYKSEADMRLAEHYGARGMDADVWCEAYTIGDAREVARAKLAAELASSGLF